MLPYVYMYLDVIQNMFCIHTCFNREKYIYFNMDKKNKYFYHSKV